MAQTLGTCIIVLDSTKEKVLLGKRLNSYKSGMYGLPGGRLEITEQLMECSKRELLEETGLKADFLEYVGVIRELQEGYSFIHFAFLCHDFKGDPKVTEPDKCEAWEWFQINNLPNNLLSGHQAALEIFLNPERGSLRDI